MINLLETLPDVIPHLPELIDLYCFLELLQPARDNRLEKSLDA